MTIRRLWAPSYPHCVSQQSRRLTEICFRRHHLSAVSMQISFLAMVIIMCRGNEVKASRDHPLKHNRVCFSWWLWDSFCSLIPQESRGPVLKWDLYLLQCCKQELWSEGQEPAFDCKLCHRLPACPWLNHFTFSAGMKFLVSSGMLPFRPNGAHCGQRPLGTFTRTSCSKLSLFPSPWEKQQLPRWLQAGDSTSINREMGCLMGMQRLCSAGICQEGCQATNCL